MNTYWPAIKMNPVKKTSTIEYLARLNSGVCVFFFFLNECVIAFRAEIKNTPLVNFLPWSDVFVVHYE